jgi:hypothetical protein
VSPNAASRAAPPGETELEGGKIMPSTSGAPKPFQIVAAVIGNALEWYDFIVFGFFTVIIARLFFPAESQYASLLLTTATFGVGFFSGRSAACCLASMPIAAGERQRYR